MNTIKELPITAWLPTTTKELKRRDWDSVDVIVVSGDAYVDHPSFGHAVIARLLEAMGLKVGIISQPNWQDDLRDFKKLGKPNMFFAVTAGCMDSMVNHYTANRRKRSDDNYTAGGKSGFRPDYATITYSNILKKLFPTTPVVIGGVEASLRRLTHYDYWKDDLMPSILLDSNADILVYGMGEKPLAEIVSLLKRGVPFESLTTVAQTSIKISKDSQLPKNKRWDDQYLNSHAECTKSKLKFANNFKTFEEESNKLKSNTRLIQECGNELILINPASSVLTEKEMDHSFDRPYTRLPHPKYKKRGKISAFEMIKHSVTMHRGCFGGCSFCTISAHQGKFIASRSKKSILKEVQIISKDQDFKGTLTDVGGPSANMYKMCGENLEVCKSCKRPSCIFPHICKNLNTDHAPINELYREITCTEKINHLYVGSGVRYDLFSKDKSVREKLGHELYTYNLITKHTSGRLKVAPEHTSDKVLKSMRKPPFALFKKFKVKFDEICRKKKLKYQLIPYFISSHPVCTLDNMKELNSEMTHLDFSLEQVQDFTPTPMTLATVMFYSGIDPYTEKKVYVARSKEDKLEQRALFFKDQKN